MTKKENVGFWSDFKKFFLRGLATLLPTVLTIVLLFKCFEFIQDNISIHITRGMIYVAVYATDKYPKISEKDESAYKKSPAYEEAKKKGGDEELNEAELQKDIRRWKLEKQWTKTPQSLVGFFIAMILVYMLGRILASIFGRKIWSYFEGTVQRVPGFKQVYPYIKQVTEFLFAERKISLKSRVVAVPYPRQGIWSIGLLTGTGFRQVREETREELVTVFIPSSPTPVTGYVICVKRSEVIELPITLEEAIRFTVSGGVIVPDHQMVSGENLQLIPGPSIEAKKEGDNKSELQTAEPSGPDKPGT
jgi:uncharacterized membrane protein